MYEVVKKYCLTLKTNDYPHPAGLKQILKNKNRKKSTKKQSALFNEKLWSKFIFLSVLCLVGCLKLQLTNMQTCVSVIAKISVKCLQRDILFVACNLVMSIDWPADPLKRAAERLETEHCYLLVSFLHSHTVRERFTLHGLYYIILFSTGKQPHKSLVLMSMSPCYPRK